MTDTTNPTHAQDHFTQVQTAKRQALADVIKQETHALTVALESKFGALPDRVKKTSEELAALTARLEEIPGKRALLDAEEARIKAALINATEENAFEELTAMLTAIPGKRAGLETIEQTLVGSLIPEKKEALRRDEEELEALAVQVARERHAAKRAEALRTMEKINGELEAFEFAVKDIARTIPGRLSHRLHYDLRFKLLAEGVGLR